MIESILDSLIRFLADPSAFWLVYGVILFAAFLLLVGAVESLILKKPLNAFVMGTLFAVYVFFGVQWGRSVAPTGSVHVWKFGVEPASEFLCPADSPIKGALQRAGTTRCFYHFPGADSYNQIRPDRCYARREEAMADGCEQPKF